MDVVKDSERSSIWMNSKIPKRGVLVSLIANFGYTMVQSSGDIAVSLFFLIFSILIFSVLLGTMLKSFHFQPNILISPYFAILTITLISLLWLIAIISIKFYKKVTSIDESKHDKIIEL